MPSISFDDLDTNLQPVPAWRFFCTLPSLPGLAQDGSVLSFLVTKFVGTSRGVQYEQVPFQGGARNFPTAFHTDNVQVQVIEHQRFLFTKYIKAWLNLVIDESGAYGLPRDYKRRLRVQALGFDGQTLENFGWDLCSPTVPDGFDWDGSSTHYLMTGCGFVVDGARTPRTIGASSMGGTDSAPPLTVNR